MKFRKDGLHFIPPALRLKRTVGLVFQKEICFDRNIVIARYGVETSLDIYSVYGNISIDMHESLSSEDVILYCREREKAWRKAAEAFEAASRLEANSVAPGQQNSRVSTSPTVSAPDIEMILKALSTRPARVGDLAKKFAVSHDTIRDLIHSPDSGIVKGAQGWLKIIKNDHK